MNPVLIKPSGAPPQPGVVMGQPVRATPTRAPTRQLKHELRPDRRRARWPTCASASTSSSARAPGSPAEINLRDADLANMGLARAAGLPVSWSATSTAAASSRRSSARWRCSTPRTRRHVAGFVINKFRGDDAILAPGLDAARASCTGRPTLGVLPYARRTCGSTSRTRSRSRAGAARDAGRRRDTLRRRGDPPALDEQLHRRSTRWRPSRACGCASRARRPTSSAPTSSSCPGPRRRSRTSSGCAPTGWPTRSSRARPRGQPILGICGGYQMLGERDRRRGRVRGAAPSRASACCR